jgi:hypothetical protein
MILHDAGIQQKANYEKLRRRIQAEQNLDDLFFGGVCNY